MPATHNHYAVEHGLPREENLHTTELFEDKELMTDAQNAENREHEMTLLQAVMDHPAACFWAFVFCFTIVRKYTRACQQDQELI